MTSDSIQAILLETAGGSEYARKRKLAGAHPIVNADVAHADQVEQFGPKDQPNGGLLAGTSASLREGFAMSVSFSGMAGNRRIKKGPSGAMVALRTDP
jgi:hypothetical protein